jgi:hypothetical protein
VGAAFMDDDWSQPASIQDTAEASHSRSGGMSTGVVSSHSHSSLRIMRPSGTLSRASLAASPPPGSPETRNCTPLMSQHQLHRTASDNIT